MSKHTGEPNPNGKSKRTNRPYRHQCGANAKSTQKPCTRPALANGRCKYHGGMSVPAGPGHHAWKHGRFSSQLGKFGVAYEESLQSEAELLDLTEPLAILDVQVKRAAERLDQLDTAEFRKNALALYREARALLHEDPDAAATKLAELGTLLNRGVKEDRAFRSLARSVEQFSRRAEAAWKIKLAAHNAINVGDVQAAFATFVTILTQEVSDSEAVARVVNRFHSACSRASADVSRPAAVSEPDGD